MDLKRGVALAHDARREGPGNGKGGIVPADTAGKFRHVPVVDQGRLVGMVSIGDVVNHRLHEIENESNALREYILTA